MRIFIVFVICACLLTRTAQAQTLTGLLQDPDGQPIPYARVFAQGTHTGAVTGEDGTFLLKLSPGAYQIVVEHMGFEKEVIPVTLKAGANQTLTHTLRPSGYAVGEVEIATGRRDPAYAIMEQLIEHKQAQIRELPSFTRETYLKIRLERDSVEKKKTAPDTVRPIDTAVFVTTLPWPNEDVIAALDTLYPPPPEDTLLVIELQPDVPLTTLPWPTEAAFDTLPSSTLITTLPWPTDSAVALAEKSRPAPERGPASRIQTLLESKGTAYFQPPGNYRTVLSAYRQHSRNDAVLTDVVASNELNYRIALADPYLYNPDPTRGRFDFYRNLVSVRSIGDVPWVSPLHSDLWRVTYTYKLEEKKLVDGWVVYKIAVTPRNNQGNAVEGTLYVVDGAWVLREIDLKLLPASLSFFKAFRLHHRYEMQPDGQWLLGEEEYTYEIKDGKETLKGSSRAVHTDYKTDVAHPRNWFGNEVVTVQERAFDQDSAYWASVTGTRPDSVEHRFARRLDSIATHLRDPKYLREQDSLENHLSFLDVVWRGTTYNNRAHQWRAGAYPLVSLLRPGIGEPLRYGLGGNFTKTFARYTVLDLTGDVNYGAKKDDFRGGVDVGFVYAPKRFARANFRIGNRYELVNPNASITALLSAIPKSWQEKIFPDAPTTTDTIPQAFINRKIIGAGHRMELTNGLVLAVNVDYAHSQRVAYGIGVSYGEEKYAPFIELVTDMTLSYTPFNKYQMLPYRKVNLGSKWPTFSLQYKKAISGVFGSQTNFDMVRLRIRHEFTFSIFGTSRWTVDFGTFPNQDSLPDVNHVYFRGSDPGLFVNPLNNFQLLGSDFNTPNEYNSGHYTHDFGRALTNKVPLVRRTQLMTSAGGSILWIRDANFWHSEAYAGLQYPFRIRRERFKVGVFFVAAYGTYPQAVSAQFKFGVSFYDQVRRRWEY